MTAIRRGGSGPGRCARPQGWRQRRGARSRGQHKQRRSQRGHVGRRDAEQQAVQHAAESSRPPGRGRHRARPPRAATRSPRGRREPRRRRAPAGCTRRLQLGLQVGVGAPRPQRGEQAVDPLSQNGRGAQPWTWAVPQAPRSSAFMMPALRPRPRALSPARGGRRRSGCRPGLAVRLGVPQAPLTRPRCSRRISPG